MVIKKAPFYRMNKLENPEFAERILDIVESHNPETLKINDVYDLAVAKKPEIEGLKVRHGRHPITSELKLKRKMRLMYAASIVHKMSVVVRENAKDISREVTEAKIIIDIYLLNLGVGNNEEVINQKMTQFFMLIDSNEALETTMLNIEITPDINNLRNTHSEIKELTKMRLQLLTKRPKAETDKKLKVIRKVLTDLFMQIEVASLKNTDLDYRPLINEINGVIDNYRELVNTRYTINEKKAAKQEEGLENQIPQ